MYHDQDFVLLHRPTEPVDSPPQDSSREGYPISTACLQL